MKVQIEIKRDYMSPFLFQVSFTGENHAGYCFGSSPGEALNTLLQRLSPEDINRLGGLEEEEE